MSKIQLADINASTLPAVQNQRHLWQLDQAVNKDPKAILEISTMETSKLVFALQEAEKADRGVSEIDKDICYQNELESRIERLQAFYGQDNPLVVKEREKLAERPERLEVLKAERRAAIERAMSNHLPIAIGRFRQLNEGVCRLMLLQVLSGAMKAITGIEQAINIDLLIDNLLMHQYSLSLVEIAHVCNQFANGTRKVYGKLDNLQFMQAVGEYVRERANLVEEWQEQQLNQRQRRSESESKIAANLNRERLARTERNWEASKERAERADEKLKDLVEQAYWEELKKQN